MDSDVCDSEIRDGFIGARIYHGHREAAESNLGKFCHL
jgi:hypothetical protein